MRFLKYIFVLAASAFSAEADNAWVCATDDFTGNYSGVSVANGEIGLLPERMPMQVRYVTLNGIMDCDRCGNVSRAVYGINPFCVEMKVNGAPIDSCDIVDWSQQLDLRHGRHITRWSDRARNFDAECEFIALRNLPHVALMNLCVTARKDCEIDLVSTMNIPADYIDTAVNFKYINLDHFNLPQSVLHADATTFGRKYRSSAASQWCFPSGGVSVSQKYPEATMKLKKGDTAKVTLAAAVCTSRDFYDCHNEADREVIYVACNSLDRLLAEHDRLWDDLWLGDIEIDGDEEANRVVKMALYSLYSFGREGSRQSISPMGLSAYGWGGHVFWDAEIWMHPAMLFMNLPIAKSMIDYRYDRRDAAHRRAAAWGYRGAMFPWESDDNGEESTPTPFLTGPMQHHITPDVGLATWNYFRMTQDTLWLREVGYPLISDVADFCVSRADRNADGSFSVRNVVGADEYAVGVDDNAYTNGAMKVALAAAVKAARCLGLEPDDKWADVADGVRILKNDNGIVLEHAAYSGQTIKQADATLLGYPLGLIDNQDSLIANLDYYAERIDNERGPAMSYGVMAIDYARAGQTDKAYHYFKKGYQPNMRAPFGVLAETATSDNPYFTTGGAAILQAVICGWCGLELTDDGIVQHKVKLPKHWKSVTVRGVGSDRKTYVQKR